VIRASSGHAKGRPQTATGLPPQLVRLAAGWRRETTTAVARPIRLRGRQRRVGVAELLVRGQGRAVGLVRSVRLGGSGHLCRGSRNQSRAEHCQNRFSHFQLPNSGALCREQMRFASCALCSGDNVRECGLLLRPASRSGEQFFCSKNFPATYSARGRRHRAPLPSSSPTELELQRPRISSSANSFGNFVVSSRIAVRN
jgi:hypothetical protein